MPSAHARTGAQLPPFPRSFLSAACALSLAALAACVSDGRKDAPTQDQLPMCKDTAALYAAGVNYQVLSPNGGEVYHVGDTLPLRFCSADTMAYGLGNPEIRLSVNGGAKGIKIIPYDQGNRAVLHWVIPDSVQDTFTKQWFRTVTDHARIQIYAYANGDIDNDGSDSDFTIQPRR